MDTLQLRPHVSFAIVDGRAVFLDISRDRYFALDPEAETAFRRWRETGALPSSADGATARLLATGLFAAGSDRGSLAPVEIHVPDRGPDGLRDGSRFHPIDVPEIWWLVSRMRRALASRRVGETLAALGRLRSKVGAPAAADETAALTARFRAARSLVAIKPSCLQDSLALGLWLARRSARPAIVFGVKLDPFAAHCWVQNETAILNDAPDIVTEFTPILALS